MQKTMCGLVKEKSGAGEYVYKTDLSIPSIDADEVLIKVHCTGICGTDMHIIDWDTWSEKFVKAPLIAGHETAGDIIAVGENVKDRKVGDRVSIETHIPCNDCYFCKNDMRRMCANMKLFGCNVDGAFAEYCKVRSDCTYVIADSVSYEEACMFEPMGSGVHGVEKAEVEGKSVLVIGCGPIGLTVVSACKTFGAAKVIACDILEEPLEIALKMGADVVLNNSVVDMIDECLRLTDGLGVDAVIDVSGAPSAMQSALKSLKAGGRMVCVGLPSKPVALDLANDLIYREIEFTGICGRRIWDTWTNFEKVMNGPYYKSEYLIGRSFKLAEYKEAFDHVRNGGARKTLLYP